MTTKTLVLLPGLMCDAAVWAPQVQALSASHHCMVMDWGLTDSLTAMAQQVLAAAPATFALAGHSMGGRVALEVMRLAPERVERLVLLDGVVPRELREDQFPHQLRKFLDEIYNRSGMMLTCKKSSGVATPAGTVMLAAVPVILGLQFILAFLGYDIASVPRRPLWTSRAGARPRRS
mgnify:CR=1 FL=1